MQSCRVMDGEAGHFRLKLSICMTYRVLELERVHSTTMEPTSTTSMFSLHWSGRFKQFRISHKRLSHINN